MMKFRSIREFLFMELSLNPKMKLGLLNPTRIQQPLTIVFYSKSMKTSITGGFNIFGSRILKEKRKTRSKSHLMKVILKHRKEPRLILML